MKKPSLNNTLAARIERIAAQAISQLGQCAAQEEDDVVDEKGFEETLSKQEGVLPRRATLLGPESEERYLKKAAPIHDGKGRFRRSDAKG